MAGSDNDDGAYNAGRDCFNPGGSCVQPGFQRACEDAGMPLHGHNNCVSHERRKATEHMKGVDMLGTYLCILHT